MKLFSRDLNPSPYLPHPTSIYTCEVTTVPRTHDSEKKKRLTKLSVNKFEFVQ